MTSTRIPSLIKGRPTMDDAKLLRQEFEKVYHEEYHRNDRDTWLWLRFLWLTKNRPPILVQNYLLYLMWAQQKELPHVG